MELAIFMPMLVILLMGAVDFGRVVVTSIAVSNAVRAGAQWGAQRAATAQNTTGIQNAALADYGTRYGTLTFDSTVYRCRCPGSTANVTCNAVPSPCTASYGTTNNQPQEVVIVAARQTVNLFIRVPGWGTSVTTSRMATVRVQ